MRQIFSHFFSWAWQPLFKPDQAVVRTFQKAMDQEAVFQMEHTVAGNTGHVYLTPKTFEGHELVLTSSEPYFMVPGSWEKQVRPFRFLIQPVPGKPLLLHKLHGKIIRVAKDKRTIVMALPKKIIAMERRHSLRLRPKSTHMPHITVWGVCKGQEEQKGVRLAHHPILDVTQKGEAYKTILNISASGIRLALDLHLFKRNADWLEPNRRLIVQLEFDTLPGRQAANHLFVAKVCNNRLAGVSRPEIGIRFMASRITHPTSRWEPVQDIGCDRLAGVVQALEVQYYSEVKQRLSLRCETAHRKRPESR